MGWWSKWGPWRRETAPSPTGERPVITARARSSRPRMGGGGTPTGRPDFWRSHLGASGILWADEGHLALMEELRRTLPVVDRSVHALTQLVGGFEWKGSAAAERDWEQWSRSVRVNQQGRGLRSWSAGLLNSMLVYGKGVGEIVHNRDRSDIYALVNLDSRTIHYRLTDHPLVLEVLQRQQNRSELKVLPRERTMVSLWGDEVDRVHGVSMFRACGFVAQAQRTVENACQQDWLRRGAPPIHINVEFGDGVVDPEGTIAGEVLDELKAEWDKVMAQARTPEEGKVVDYFTSGTVRVQVVGAEGSPLTVTEPYRVFQEQIIAVTGLPAWLLGMHWTSSQHLAQQQAELLIAHLEAIRRQLDPRLDELVDLRGRLTGRKGRIERRWTKLCLKDLTEQMRALAWEQQALQRRIANYTSLWSLGMIDQERASRYIDPELGPIALPMLLPLTQPDPGTDKVQSDDGYGE